MLGVRLSLLTVIVGHATFCIVVVYNNVVARLRRTSGSFEEASADLGAHTWQTFRFVTFPSMKTALAAGALLAFALSFDEIIVTTFTIGAGEETLPIWIFRNLFRPNQLPIVDAVAVIVILISIIPVYLAHRLSREEGAASAPKAAAERSRPRRPRYRRDMAAVKRTGNWSPEGKAERAALRRDYQELTPAQRVEQVFELSKFMSQVAEAGRRQRLG